MRPAAATNSVSASASRTRSRAPPSATPTSATPRSASTCRVCRGIRSSWGRQGSRRPITTPSVRRSTSATCCSQIGARSASPGRFNPRPTSIGTRSRSTSSRSRRSAASMAARRPGRPSSTSTTATAYAAISTSRCSARMGSCSTSAAIRTSPPTSLEPDRATISTTRPAGASASSIRSSARCTCRRACRPAADQSRAACL